MARKKSDAAPSPKKGTSRRELALEIALHGSDAVEASESEIRGAEEYLATLATADGRVELGKTLLILHKTIERANDEANDKTLLDALGRYAELVRLADFSATDAATRAEATEREAQALAYLESTGVIPGGLDLLEAARLVAQYVVDDIRGRDNDSRRVGN